MGIGRRHALSPRTIMVARDKILDSKIISDLKIYGVHTYDNNAGHIDKFKKNMKKILKRIEENPDNPDNPVFDFLKIEDLILTSYGRKQIVNKITGLMTEILENLRIAENIKKGVSIVTFEEVTLLRFTHVAIDNLLVENYVYLGEKSIKEIKALEGTLKEGNYWLDSLKFNFYQNAKDSITKRKAELAHTTVESIITQSKKIIKTTNNVMQSIKQGKFDNVEAKILLLNSEHEKLLKETK